MNKKYIIKILDKFWSFFISLKLTFVLLIIIILGAIIGMGFDQTISFDEFLSNNNHADLKTNLYYLFEVNDAFHSWWFSLAIVLLSANLIACSLERLPRIYFDAVNPRPFLTNRRLLGLSFKKNYEVESEIKAFDLIKLFYGQIKYRKNLINNNIFFYAEKHFFGRFGVYVVHISLLIIMYSSIYATQNGINGNVLIEEGKYTRYINSLGPFGISYEYDLGFYIGCDDFRLKTFVDNTPMEYESDLYVLDKNKNRLFSKTIRVNDPLQYAGFTFYQANFRPIISEKKVDIQISNKKGYKQVFKLPLNSKISLPNGHELQVTKIYEDFGGLGQAIKISEKIDEFNSNSFHVFRRYPEFDGIVRDEDYQVVFLDVDQSYATGLSIGFVPGIWVIFFGFALFLCGLFMCFYMIPTRYFARVTKKDDGTAEVFLASQGFRFLDQVKEDFFNRCSIVDESLGK